MIIFTLLVLLATSMLALIFTDIVETVLHRHDNEVKRSNVGEW